MEELGEWDEAEAWRARGAGPRGAMEGAWKIGRGTEGSVNLGFPREGSGPSCRRSAVGGERRGIGWNFVGLMGYKSSVQSVAGQSSTSRYIDLATHQCQRSSS